MISAFQYFSFYRMISAFQLLKKFLLSTF